MKKSLLVCLGAVVVSAALYCLYISSSRYTIIMQKSYTASFTSGVTRGFAVRSFDELGVVLDEYDLEAAEFEADFGRVEFGNTFVFFSENGRLLEISRGHSGFDVAVIDSCTNLSVAVVRGPKSRPLKAVLPDS